MRIRPSVVFLGIVAACSGKGDTARPGPVAKPTAVESANVLPVMERVKVAAVPLPLFQASQQIVGQEQQQAPWTLTASDGSGLLVTKVEAKAVLQGPLAFTELHLHFHNTEDRVREGTFAITLPSGAAVSRFAMKMDNGQFMEAEIVEKQLARRAYEDNLHRKTDPALLEKAPGNQFTARVFPIPAKADKHLVISFSQELPGTRYTLPLRGLPKIEALDIGLAVTGLDGKTTEQKLSQRNWTPDRDFVSDAPSAAEALYAGQYVVAQISPFDQAQVAVDKPTAITLLVDTSASRALGFERYARNVRELIASMVIQYGDGLQLELIAFDQDTHSIFSGRAADVGDAQVRALIERGAAGASDLGQALASIDAPKSRVVVITDGVITAGKETADLRGMVGNLAKKQVERIDIVLAGGIRDEAMASALVTSGLRNAGAVLDMDHGLTDVVAGIGEKVMADVPVEIAGADWVYPKVIKSARASARTMVYAKMSAPTQTIQVKVAGRTRAIGLAGGTPALVERAAATAEIAELETKLEAAQGKERKELREQIATKSVAARVISSQTAMLVLETDGDYARYGIDRKSLTDILVVGPSGIEQKRRAAQIAMGEPAKPQITKKPATKTATTKNVQTADKLVEEESKPEKRKAKQDEGGSEGESMTDLEDLKKESKDEVARLEAPSDSAPAAEPMPQPSAPPPPPVTTGATMGSSAVADGRSMDRADAPRVASPSPRPPSRDRFSDDQVLSQDRPSGPSREQWPPAGSPAALKGPLAEIDRAIKRGNVDLALEKARAWHAKDPSDVLALIGMGDALEAKKDLANASRMYGSLIDLFPGRADLRRFAGERLERIGAQSRALMIDTYQRAVEERPDHMTGHRLLAYALVKDSRFAEAFTAILRGIDQKYPSGRFQGGERVLTEDAGLIGAAYVAADPTKTKEVTAELGKRGLTLATGSSTRFILYWETDANDVDFHIQDSKGGHAFYGAKQLPSGGELYADVTTGYGPEEFAIQGKPTAGPYKISINYYSQGPMGYGMGLLQILRHDGKGKLTFQDRPYVIMNDHAYVDLGSYKL
ncbi:MAG: hypothetical protein H0T46_12245 [Deltaproteobacteria bacterium]|nr:hypothetical protein [Deltaproteobacteria bacterium]